MNTNTLLREMLYNIYKIFAFSCVLQLANVFLCVCLLVLLSNKIMEIIA